MSNLWGSVQVIFDHLVTNVISIILPFALQYIIERNPRRHNPTSSFWKSLSEYMQTSAI